MASTTTSDEEKRLVIWKSMPCVPFKGIERFYDIGGLLADPVAFNYTIELMKKRLSDRIDPISSIGCFDARGFLWAPVLGYIFKKPVFMLRKADKMPNIGHSLQYSKEYEDDSLGIQKGVIASGDRVLLVDDLIATGGTLEAGIALVESQGALVEECMFIVELTVLSARKNIAKKYPNIPIWSIVTDVTYSE